MDHSNGVEAESSARVSKGNSTKLTTNSTQAL